MIALAGASVGAAVPAVAGGGLVGLWTARIAVNLLLVAAQGAGFLRYRALVGSPAVPGRTVPARG
ncbi:hypothetical protein [Streptosporangium sandarakinum]|uniref:hypothetical protein n=1 Tax=Streptosporangium sandarakinum TaxID=1260955 RepID=UPI00344137E3